MPNGQGYDRAGCVREQRASGMRHDEGISARIEDTEMRGEGVRDRGTLRAEGLVVVRVVPFDGSPLPPSSSSSTSTSSSSWRQCERHPGSDRRRRRGGAGRGTVRVGDVCGGKVDARRMRDEEAGGGGGKRPTRAHVPQDNCDIDANNDDVTHLFYSNGEGADDPSLPSHNNHGGALDGDDNE